MEIMFNFLKVYAHLIIISTIILLPISVFVIIKERKPLIEYLKRNLRGQKLQIRNKVGLGVVVIPKRVKRA